MIGPTPRPWYAERASDTDNTWAIKAETAPAFFVAECFIIGDCDSAQANAELIVKAVNAYAPLIPSPYLRQETLSAKDRALKIAADALEAIGREKDEIHAASYARDELARIRTLVPEIDA